MQKDWKKAVILALGLVCSTWYFATPKGEAAENVAKQDKAVVVVSFGTTFKEAQEKDLGGIEAAIKEAFANRAFYHANTSYIVMKRNAKNGIHISDLKTVLTTLKQAGFTDVLVQPTHLLTGEEYNKKVLGQLKPFYGKFTKLAVGEPLMTNLTDWPLAATALATQFPVLEKTEGVVLMGHGSPRDNNKSFGKTYKLLQKYFDELNLPVVVGTVEEADSPNLQAVAALVEERGYKLVHMYPLMVVAGDHAHNDMYGKEPTSWKNVLEKEGVKTVGHMEGLGRNKAIQALYVQHALRAAAQVK